MILKVQLPIYLLVLHKDPHSLILGGWIKILEGLF